MLARARRCGGGVRGARGADRHARKWGQGRRVRLNVSRRQRSLSWANMQGRPVLDKWHAHRWFFLWDVVSTLRFLSCRQASDIVIVCRGAQLVRAVARCVLRACNRYGARRVLWEQRRGKNPTQPTACSMAPPTAPAWRGAVFLSELIERSYCPVHSQDHSKYQKFVDFRLNIEWINVFYVNTNSALFLVLPFRARFLFTGIQLVGQERGMSCCRVRHWKKVAEHRRHNAVYGTQSIRPAAWLVLHRVTSTSGKQGASPSRCHHSENAGRVVRS